MKRNLRSACLAVLAGAALLLLAIHGSAYPKKPAEKPYALIFGTVWNAQDRVAPGVVVKIRRADEKKARWELVSDARGEFAQRVPPGAADYIVWAEIKGRKGPAAETKVHIDNDEHQDLGLHLADTPPHK